MVKHYELDMCNGPILKKMLIFTFPLMLSSILQLLFNAADIVVVGRFAGDNSLAAVGSNTALINLLTNLFIGLSIGANVLAARHYGANETSELSKTVHTAMLLSVFSGIILTIVGIIFARQLLTLMKTPDEVLDLAVTYLRVYFLGMTSMMIYNFGSALLRAVGDTKRPLAYLFCSGVINVILNIVFVVALKMDVAGVALATSISETVSAVLIVRCMMHETGGIQLIPSELHFDRKKFVSIIRIGLPAGFQGVIFSLSNVVIQSSVNLFGNTIVAGNSAAQNIEGFIYVAMNSFYQSTISFTSQNYGAKKYDRITRILITGLICVVVTGVVLGQTGLLFGRELLGIYSQSPEVIDAGMYRMRVIFNIYFLCGIMDVMVGALRGIGYSVMPMIVSLLGACGIRLVWIATVFNIEKYHNITTIYLSYPVSWVITVIAHVICYVIVRKKLKTKLQTES
jgi:putative MATE family efflux protein